AINGIVSCAQLYRIPLLMLISQRGGFGERDPWQTEGGAVTEQLLDALRIPHERLEAPGHVAHRIRQAQPLPYSANRPVPLHLLHVVFDNESLLSVGGFPTATATGSDLAGIAAAAGVPRSTTVRALAEFTDAFDAALAAHDLTTIVAKVEATGPAGFVTDLGLLENRFQFQRHLRELQRKE